MKLVLTASVMLVVLAITVFGAGTFAYLSGEETSTGDTFTVDADEPDLELSPCGSQPYLPFDVSDVNPGDSGVADINLTNAGTVDGWLSMKIINCTNDENERLEPESEAGDITPDEGELGSKLYLEIWFDDDNDGEIGTGEQLIKEDYVDNLCEIKISIDAIMESGMTWTIGIKWSVASDVGNITQSDRLTFDIAFTLSEEQ